MVREMVRAMGKKATRARARTQGCKETEGEDTGDRGRETEESDFPPQTLPIKATHCLYTNAHALSPHLTFTWVLKHAQRVPSPSPWEPNAHTHRSQLWAQE